MLLKILFVCYKERGGGEGEVEERREERTKYDTLYNIKLLRR